MDEVLLAREALTQYGLQDAQITVVRHLDNLVCRVGAPDGPTYALRLCAPAVTSARLVVELSWLEALVQDTDLQVPTLRRNRAGEAVSVLRDSSTGRQRLCVVFDWLEGEPASRAMSPSLAEAIGALSSKLHRHARAWQIPSGYVGPRYDLDWLSGPHSWWRGGRARRDLGDRVWKELDPAVGLVEASMRRLGQAPQAYGLIHSDLHLGNVLVQGDRLKVIDFDGCALGYFLFDLAVTCIEFDDFDEGDHYTDAFLTAYCKAASAPSIANDVFNSFCIAAHLVFLEWVYSSENPEVRAQKMQWVPGSVAGIRSLAQHQGGPA